MGSAADRRALVERTVAEFPRWCFRFYSWCWLARQEPVQLELFR